MNAERVSKITTPSLPGDLLAISPEQIRSSKPYLRAHMDIQLGKDYDDISLDDEKILARMRDERLSDDNIDALGIYISAEPQAVNGGFIYGEYKQDSEPSITLFPNSVIANWESQAQRHFNADPEKAYCTIPESRVISSGHVSKTLYHELRHARQDLAEGILEGIHKSHNRRLRLQRGIGVSAGLLSSLALVKNAMDFVPQNGMGGVMAGLLFPVGAVATAHVAEKYRTQRAYDDYLSELNEIDARAAAEEIDQPVVHLKPKAEATTWMRDDFPTSETPPKPHLLNRMRNLALHTLDAIANMYQ